MGQRMILNTFSPGRGIMPAIAHGAANVSAPDRENKLLPQERGSGGRCCDAAADMGFGFRTDRRIWPAAWNSALFY